MIKWTDEAVRAALCQAKAGRFSNMTAQEAMREILCAAAHAQGLTEATSRRSLPALQQSFEIFWHAYPCKKGKVAAEKAFKKVEREIDAIMSGLEQYKHSKPDYADWMHPATFLNQRRWEDEYDAPVTGKTYNTQKDGLALLLQEANRREAHVAGQDQIAGNVVQLVSRSDVERGSDESESRDISGRARALF